MRTSAHRLLATRADGQGLHYSFLGWESRRYRTWAVAVSIDHDAATVVLPEWHPGRPVRLPRRSLPAQAGVWCWLTLQADLSVPAAGQLNPSGFACCEDPTLNHAQIAARAKFKSRIHFERALGYAPWSATTKRGKHYPAKYAEYIDVNTAGVIVRELGIAPREVPAL